MTWEENERMRGRTRKQNKNSKRKVNKGEIEFKCMRII